MAPFRVLVLSPSLEERGGVQRYTTTLATALGQILPAENVRVLAVAWTRRGPAGLSLLTKIRFVGSAVRAAIGWRPRLVICTHVGLAPLGWLLGFLCRCRCWVAAHGIEVWDALPFAKRLGLRNADQVLCVSAFTRERVIRCHPGLEKTTCVLPNALADSLLSVPPDPEVCGRLGANRRRVILTVGRLSAAERYKGHDVVLQALPRIAESCPEVMYLIAGEGDDRRRLDGLARELGVEQHVLFVGEMNDAGLAACYQACAVFVLPAKTLLRDHGSQGEGFGIAFVEAMAFGKPVIGPNGGAPAEFLRHGQHGFLVDPQSPEEVAQAVLALFSDPERAARMGEAGRALVLSEFSLGAMSRRIKGLLPEESA